MAFEVRESQVEDVLATYPSIVRRLLDLDEDAALVARQMPLPSGRLDLLFLTGNTLLLIELKVVPFNEEFVSQVQNYQADLVALQQVKKLVQATIVPILLCPSIADSDRDACQAQGIQAVQYDPKQVLSEFYQRFVGLSAFARLTPSDHGIWNIHLINHALRAISNQSATHDLPQILTRSAKTIANQMRFAQDICLVVQKGRNYELTALGKSYVHAMAEAPTFDGLTEEQAALLRAFIVDNPFATPTIYGIFSMVQSVFDLARNTYPVPWSLLLPYFRDYTGNHFGWSAEKTWYHGTRMYSNYAIELGLLARQNKGLFLTPAGTRFILMLQLHKSIKMVDALQLRDGT
jgi:hypothetical protein